MARTKKVTQAQANRVLRAVADWMYQQNGYTQPIPTGEDAAYRGLGPMLNMTWDWPSSGPTPTVLLEGGPVDWAVRCCQYVQELMDARKIPVFVEPYSSYALCIYRED